MDNNQERFDESEFDKIPAAPAVAYILQERKNFTTHHNWVYEDVRVTTKVEEAIAWKNSDPWHTYLVKPINDATATKDGFIVKGE